MATLLAPYNTAMQLGSGFNSFTQQLCVDHAVVHDKGATEGATAQQQGPIAQSVAYKASIIDKVTDVTSTMNVNPAFAIKYDTFDAKGKGDFINMSKVKESDVAFLISVRVVNQVIYDHSLNVFNPISELKNANFADVYGDCFVSGFQEGGEFIAVISIKANDRRKAESIKANAAVEFTKDKLSLSLNGDFGKENDDIFQENETTVSVTWTGGGQDLKKPEDDWSFENMKAAALKFPELVARTPMRTHAILTKYTSLRSFFAATQGASKSVIPNFEKAGVYTALLQEAYLDYKTIAKDLQVLAYDVSAGVQRLEPGRAALAAEKAGDTVATTEAAAAPSDESKHTGTGSDSDSIVAVGEPAAPASPMPSKPYPPSLHGLESARQAVRQMLNRIVAEVDTISRTPELAVDENRKLPYTSPFLFKELLPLGVLVPQPAPAALGGNTGQETPAPGMTDLANKSGGVIRF